MTMQQLLDQFASDATEFYAIHQRYITDAWGTFRLTGETYRQKGEKDWIAAKAALLQLKAQASTPIPLLQRTSLTIVLNAMQGMQIRLTQRFAETPNDPAIKEDQAKSQHLWQALNRIDRELYQQLG